MINLLSLSNDQTVDCLLFILFVFFFLFDSIVRMLFYSYMGRQYGKGEENQKAAKPLKS